MFRSIFMLIFVCPVVILAQDLDSLGLDDNALLNRDESTFLNKTLVQFGDQFDFTNTKIAFVTGSAGTRIIGKKHYFEKLILPWIEQDMKPVTFYKKLTVEEKEISGGYDAIVFAWVKWYTEKKKTILVRKLGKAL